MYSEKDIRIKVEQFLLERFNLNELKDLAFDLGVDFELFVLQNKREFCRELVTYFERRQKFNCLISEIVKRHQDREMVQLLVDLPPCSAVKKIQFVFSKDFMDDPSELLRELAVAFNVAENEVGLIGAAKGGRLLFSLPEEAISPQNLSKIQSLWREKYPVASIATVDSKDPVNQSAWRYVVSRQLRFQESRILPTIHWKEAIVATGEVSQANARNEPMQEKIGRYQVKREIGKGGMAVVYLARDPMVDRDIAIKVIKEQFSADPNFRQRFQQEIRLVATLEHPAVVPVYDVGEYEGQLFLVMRYMSGGTLRQRLDNEGVLPASEVSSILKRLVTALEEAHRQNIIHRDIKPDNVLLDDRGNVYLSDFGIARIAEQSTGISSTIIGTPGYMSPEQWQMQSIDVRTDVYQLGVMLFEMLTGNRPFAGDNLANQHLNEPVPSAKEINPRLPSGCDAVLKRALAKRPNERFATPSELVRALSTALGEQKINARYQIKEVLGHGRLADVYLAYDPDFKRNVVVKVMKNKLLSGLPFQQRFRRDAETFIKLEHPAMVPIYDISKHDDKPFIVTRYMSGGSLKERLQAKGKLPLDEVCQIATRLADVLDEFHTQGFIHRDIKPSNIMLDETGLPYLSGFGTLRIAELTNKIVQSDDVVGSRHYMAPEQWLQEDLDAYTDVYQFGVMLFELLTGRLPFTDDDPVALMDKHLDETLPSIHEINSDLPSACDAVIKRATAKFQKERFNSIGELANALKEVNTQYILDTSYSKGVEAYNQTNWSEAIVTFEKLSKIQPNYRKVQEYLTNAREQKRRSDIYEKGKLEYDEQNWAGAVYWFKQITNYRDADFRRRQAQQQEDLVKLYVRGKNQFERKRWYLARKSFKKIEQLNPNYEDVRYYLSETQIKINSFSTKDRLRRLFTLDRIGCLLLAIVGLIVAFFFGYYEYVFTPENGNAQTPIPDVTLILKTILTQIGEQIVDNWLVLIFITTILLVVIQRHAITNLIILTKNRIFKHQHFPSTTNEKIEIPTETTEQKISRYQEEKKGKVQHKSDPSHSIDQQGNIDSSEQKIEEEREQVSLLPELEPEGSKPQEIESVSPNSERQAKEVEGRDQALQEQVSPQNKPIQRDNEKNDIVADLHSRPVDSATQYRTGVKIRKSHQMSQLFEDDSHQKPSAHTVMIRKSYEAAIRKKNELNDECLQMSNFRDKGDLLASGNKRLFLLNGYGSFGGTSIARGVNAYVTDESNRHDILFIRIEVGWGIRVGKYRALVNENEVGTFSFESHQSSIAKNVNRTLGERDSGRIEAITQAIAALIRLMDLKSDNQELSLAIDNLLTTLSLTRFVIVIDRADQAELVKALCHTTIIENPRLSFLLVVRREKYDQWDDNLKMTIIKNYKFEDWYIQRYWRQIPELIKQDILQEQTSSKPSATANKWLENWYAHLAYIARGSLAEAFQELENQGLVSSRQNKQKYFSEQKFTNRAEEFEHNAYVYGILTDHKDEILASEFPNTKNNDRAWLGIHLLVDWIRQENTWFTYDELDKVLKDNNVRISDKPLIIKNVVDRLLKVLVRQRYLTLHKEIQSYQVIWKSPASVLVPANDLYDDPEAKGVSTNSSPLEDVKANEEEIEDYNKRSEHLNIGLLTPKTNNNSLSQRIATQLGFEVIEQGYNLFLTDRTESDKATWQKLHKLLQFGKEENFYEDKALTIITTSNDLQTDDYSIIIKVDSALKQLHQLLEDIDVLILLGTESSLDSIYSFNNLKAVVEGLNKRVHIIPIGAAGPQAANLWTQTNISIQDIFSNKISEEEFALVGPEQSNVPEIVRSALAMARSIAI